jgi:hypothetical protein
MGGTALKHLGFEGRRVSRSEYFSLIQELRKKYYYNFICLQDILSYKNKPDHGDIDLVGVLCLSSPSPKEFLEYSYYSKNSCVHSFDYKGVQIDLATLTDLNSWFYYYLFSCYSPLGNILGRIIKQKGLKWGIDGLTYPIKLSDSEQLGEIQIGPLGFHGPYEIYEKMLSFLGLTPPFGLENFKDWFENQEDIFNWVCSSKMFNKDIFAFENLNHINRKRDRLRKDYHQWMEFIKDKPNHFVGNKDKTVYIDEINSHFNVDIYKQAERLISKHTYNKFLKEKFNGKMVQEWTNLEGKELGKVIQSYKESHSNFENFIQLKTPENIKNDFQEFWLKTS